jgi:PAS domain-containing protein
VDGTNLEVMGSRFYSLERKMLLAFAIAVAALGLIGAFSVVGLAVAISLLMASLVIQNVLVTAKPSGITGRLAAIVESSDDAIISKTLDGIITSWNPAAERLFGYAATEAIGRPMLIVIPPERAHEEVEILARIRRGQRIDHSCAQGWHAD